jgi:hypothetical protein
VRITAAVHRCGNFPNVYLIYGRLCGPGRWAVRVSMRRATNAGRLPGGIMPDAKDMLFTIHLDENGQVKVDKQDGWKGKKVEWTGQDADRQWVVYMKGKTPFKEDLIISGKGHQKKGGTIRNGEAGDEFEYGVCYEGANGTLVCDDPKIVIRNDDRNLAGIIVDMETQLAEATLGIGAIGEMLDRLAFLIAEEEGPDDEGPDDEEPVD